MSIPDEDVMAVRQSTDLVALVGEYTPLKRQGRRYVGLCPFHSEKTGSFSVNGEEGLYYCFGCQASGDAITFLRAIEGASFVEAVERLAARAGIAVRNDASGPDREARDRRQAIYDAMAEAVAYYHRRLLEHPDAARARQYLRSRGLDGDTVRAFKLGWAPEGGNQLVRTARASGAALVAAGLAVEGNYGTRDAFRGRLIFPIHQTDGKPVALGARLVPGIGDQSGPKYRNSPETPIYKKRSTLYGLDLSRQAVVHDGEVIVCEGYTDVIGMFRVGLKKAVATCGTALTEDHFKLLARFAKRVILAFDADSAGQAAAARFYEWEHRHELEVAVADLPQGSDPGELASSDPERLRAAVSGAPTYLTFRLRRALESSDLRHAEGRARGAETALAVVAEHPNALVRDQYLVEVADRTRIEVDQLRPRLAAAVEETSHRQERARGRGRGSASAGGEGGGSAGEEGGGSAGEEGGSREGGGSNGRAETARRSGSEERAGRDMLALAIHEPAALSDRLHECLFSDPLQREAYQALAVSASLHEAVARTDDAVAALLVELANSDPEISVDQALVALVRTRAVEALADLQSEARAAQSEGDDARLLGLAPVIASVKSELEEMSDLVVGEHLPATVTDAAERLVAWLQRRQGEAA